MSQITVNSGPERRGVWTDQQKRELVAAVSVRASRRNAPPSKSNRNPSAAAIANFLQFATLNQRIRRKEIPRESGPQGFGITATAIEPVQLDVRDVVNYDKHRFPSGCLVTSRVNRLGKIVSI